MGEKGTASCVNKKRAFCKTALVAVLTVAAIAILASALDERTLTILKHELSLWSVIAVVLLINLVSFLCFLIMFAAYQWIRRDLKPAREEDKAP